MAATSLPPGIRYSPLPVPSGAVASAAGAARAASARGARAGAWFFDAAGGAGSGAGVPADDLPPLCRPIRIPRDLALEAAQHQADLALLLRIAAGFLLLAGMAWGSL